MVVLAWLHVKTHLRHTMGDANVEDFCFYYEDLSGSERVVECSDDEPCIVVLPCYGQGMKAPNLKEIKMPSAFYNELKVAEQNAKQVKAKSTVAKGRARTINEYREKCSWPGLTNTPKERELHTSDNLSLGQTEPNVDKLAHQLPADEKRKFKEWNFNEEFPPISSGVKLDMPEKFVGKIDNGMEINKSKPRSLKSLATAWYNNSL